VTNDLDKKETDKYKVFFEARAIPQILFKEFTEKYSQGPPIEIAVGSNLFQMSDIVVEEKVSGYLGLSQFDNEKTILVVWAWKPKDKDDRFEGTEPERLLEVVCGPTPFGGWDCVRGQCYDNLVSLSFPFRGYKADILAAKLAAMVQIRVCELLNSPHYEKTKPTYDSCV